MKLTCTVVSSKVATTRCAQSTVPVTLVVQTVVGRALPIARISVPSSAAICTKDILGGPQLFDSWEKKEAKKENTYSIVTGQTEESSARPVWK